MASSDRGQPTTTLSATRTKTRTGSSSTAHRLMLDDEELLRELTARTGQGSNRRSFTSSLGLGSGVAGRLTAAALVTLLLIAIGSPAVYHNKNHKRDDMGHSKNAGHLDDKAASTASKQPRARTAAAPHVPLTQDLQAAFYGLRYTKEKGIVAAAAEPDWQQTKDLFLSSVEKMSEGTVLKGNTPGNLRRMLAMDLACLENKAIEAQAAIDEANESGQVMTEQLAGLYQAKMEARRQLYKAADLWETKVKAGALGNEKDLQMKLTKFLAAVRARAAASEYLTSTIKQAKEEKEEAAVRRLFAEANRTYESVAFLNVSGQLAATEAKLVTEVADWLAILFVSI